MSSTKSSKSTYPLPPLEPFMQLSNDLTVAELRSAIAAFEYAYENLWKGRSLKTLVTNKQRLFICHTLFDFRWAKDELIDKLQCTISDCIYPCSRYCKWLNLQIPSKVMNDRTLQEQRLRFVRYVIKILSKALDAKTQES